jgi:hypothetical protein
MAPLRKLDSRMNAEARSPMVSVLLDLSADPEATSVGGAPQVTQIYQYGIAEQFIWRDLHGNESFGGRPLLPLEHAERRTLTVTGFPAATKVTVGFSARSAQVAGRASSVDPE